jgi:hypothetical protein
MACALFASGLIAHAQYTQSTSVGGGILEWTNTPAGPQSCGQGNSYTVYRYSNFEFIAGGATYPLSGTDAYYYLPGGTTGCPPSGPVPGPYLPLALPTSYGAGNCVIDFYPADDRGSATIACSGITGYVDPKYIVVGVTYAPPGPSTNTWVSYSSSTFVGSTNSLSNSFSSGSTYSVSLQFSIGVPSVTNGTLTGSYSYSNNQTSKKTNTITTSIQVQSGEKTYGTGNYFAPVDHDYDIVWIWLNPVYLFTLGNNTVVWNGYGYDATDQNGMDVVGIELGYLNGKFGAMPPQYASSIARTWASTQIFAAGHGPGLTGADLAQIASSDPFSVSSYGPTYVMSVPPSPSTADNRFTLSQCVSNNVGSQSFGYDQAAPSQAPENPSCTLTYTNTSTQAQEITKTSSQSFSIDKVFKASVFFAKLSAELKDTYAFTLTTDAQNSITTSATSVASFSIQGPPCNNVTPGVGPCVPVYDADYDQPTEFYVYQDNMYGTFMFAPVHYY